MGFQNVTETYQEESHPAPPSNPPIYDLDPPIQLDSPEVFSSRGSYAFEAFDEMRSKAPIMWHPEQVGRGFGPSPAMNLSKPLRSIRRLIPRSAEGF